ncbi:MAG: hypothetical protein U9Q07_03805 [Planctomycetota bacterium]|nr:hypothetical protein [Planctomycetota bacterium]
MHDDDKNREAEITVAIHKMGTESLNPEAFVRFELILKHLIQTRDIPITDEIRDILNSKKSGFHNMNLTVDRDDYIEYLLKEAERATRAYQSMEVCVANYSNVRKWAMEPAPENAEPGISTSKEIVYKLLVGIKDTEDKQSSDQ